MKQVNIREAQGILCSLIHDAEEGEEVVIARNGRSVVKVIPFQRRPNHDEITDQINKFVAENPSLNGFDTEDEDIELAQEVCVHATQGNHGGCQQKSENCT